MKYSIWGLLLSVISNGNLGIYIHNKGDFLGIAGFQALSCLPHLSVPSFGSIACPGNTHIRGFSFCFQGNIQIKLPRSLNANDLHKIS